MPLDFPIAWKSVLVDNKGVATPYFQRLLELLMANAASGGDITSAELMLVETLTPSAQNQIDASNLPLFLANPLITPPIRGSGSDDDSDHVPVGDGGEPMTILSDGAGAPLLTPYSE